MSQPGTTAAALPTGTPAPGISTSPSSTTDEAGCGGYCVLGVAVGGVVLVIIIAAAIAVCLKARRRRHEEKMIAADRQQPNFDSCVPPPLSPPIANVSHRYQPSPGATIPPSSGSWHERQPQPPYVAQAPVPESPPPPQQRHAPSSYRDVYPVEASAAHFGPPPASPTFAAETGCGGKTTAAPPVTTTSTTSERLPYGSAAYTSAQPPKRS